VIDFDRLASWMDGIGLAGKGEPIEHRFLSGGSQNEIHEIRRGDLHCAIRIPPPSAPADRDEGILREWRIIEALDGTDVPHTPAVAMCEQASVLGRPFYLMGFVDGWSPMGELKWPTPFDTDLAARAGLAYQLAEGIALLSRVDWQAKGLRDLGRPDGFHERQVDRWLAHLAACKIRELPGLDDAAAWLRTHKPSTWRPGIIHGDYQFANVMFRHGAPARLAAIVDWEMATIGDPLLDLGWVLMGWPDPDEDRAHSGYVDYSGMPSRAELCERYARGSGLPVDEIDYYVILARFKIAIVLEGGYARWLAGGADNPKMAAFGDVVLDMARKAAELARTTRLGR
jgi:aminoglycoside phosphotransferase (APT) family kinase protein